MSPLKKNSAPLFALFISNLRPGGIQRVILNLSKSLHRKGATVHILAVKGDGDLIREVPDGVDVIIFDSATSFQRLSHLSNYIRQYKPSALLSTHPNMNIIAVLAKRLSFAKTRVIVSEHNDPLLAGSYRKKTRRFTPPPFLIKLAYQWADAIVAVSEGVADGIAATTGIAREQIQVIYNPIEIERIKILSKASVSWPTVKNRDGTKLLAVGRLSPQKDVATLLQAFKILTERKPAQLLILGEGELRSELEAEVKRLGIEESVTLFGYAENPYAYMRTADVFVSSSLWEGLPTVHIEALATGCQVVSTDCPSGPFEILAGGKYGRLVPVKQPDALATAIEQTINDPLPRELLQRRAEFFNVDRSTDKYWRILSGAT